MKNKKNIFFLLPIVLLIWAVVIYQFFSFAAPAVEHATTKNEWALKPLKIKERKTFSINVNYRDPFLGKMYIPQNKVIIPKKTIKTEPKKEAVIMLPPIIYKGMIADSKQKSKIFMLVISGKNFFMKKGETHEEVLLKDGNKESVSIIYKGIKNTIALQWAG